MARPRRCRVCKSVFSTQFPVTFTFVFPQHSRLLSSKKRELATQFSFLCMPTTVSGSNSWRFAIIGGQSLEVWQHALRISDWRYRCREIFQALLPFFFFFACFRGLEIFPKKDEGTLQITVQSMTNATFETVGQVRKARQSWPVYHRLKNAFSFTFLHFFTFFTLF